MKALLEEYEKDCKCDNVWGGNNDLSKLKVLKLLFVKNVRIYQIIRYESPYILWELLITLQFAK